MPGSATHSIFAFGMQTLHDTVMASEFGDWHRETDADGHTVMKKAAPRVVRYVLDTEEPVVGLTVCKEDAALVCAAVLGHRK